MLLSMAAEAQTVRGDLNGDGKLDVADVVTLVNMVLNQESSTVPAGLEAVDLGLPSGTKWANMNVGAEKPEDVGLYFAWGETTGYGSDVSDGRNFGYESYKWCNGTNATITKYCLTEANGTVDNKSVLEPEDDAANVSWGSQWYMPTVTEIEELVSYTVPEWTTLNGVSGRKFTSTINGNSIFLPASGLRYETDIYTQSTVGNYWSSMLYELRSTMVYTFAFDADNLYTRNRYGDRTSGCTIRPVFRK